MMEGQVDPLEASFEAVEREDLGELKDEIAQLKQRMDAQAIAGARPALSGAKSSAFVEGYLRKGSEVGLEVKALVGTSDAAGGYAVPEEIDAVIDRTLASISPIRAIANVVKVGSAGYRKLVTTGGTPAGWVAEDAGRPETDTPVFVEIAPPSGELYANPAASQAMLDDAAFDVEAWLAEEIAQEFARAEGAAFVNGSGVNRPKGFLAAPVSGAVDGVRPFGTLQFINAGAAGGFAASNPQDRLIDLVQALRPPYRQGAVFVMNSATAARIRKFKTSDGAFLWQPAFALIEVETVTLIEPPLGVLGGTARLMAQSVGDGDAVASANRAISGEALRPPAPVHLQAKRAGNGDIVLSWVRRSRAGWAWLSGSDTPLGEETENYRLVLTSHGFERVVSVGEPAFVYGAGLQAEDQLAGPLSIGVTQIGTLAASRAAILTID